jgi:flagellar biosynthesis GTPase FlhF
MALHGSTYIRDEHSSNTVTSTGSSTFDNSALPYAAAAARTQAQQVQQQYEQRYGHRTGGINVAGNGSSCASTTTTTTTSASTAAASALPAMRHAPPPQQKQQQQQRQQQQQQEQQYQQQPPQQQQQQQQQHNQQQHQQQQQQQQPQPPKCNPKYATGVGLEDTRAAHILLVEDNTICQKVTRHCLQRLGCTVDVAANGRIAVDAMARTPEIYDLILMDLRMPG